MVPPALLNAAQAARRKLSREMAAWEWVPGGWDTVRRARGVRGWNVVSAVQASEVRAEFTKHVADHLPFGATPTTVNGPFTSIEAHNTCESFAHAFLSSTRLLRRASVLDWGGGLGQYFWICRALAPDLDLDYHCAELPEFVHRGRELCPLVTYYDDEGWRARQFDFVFASCSLHYVEDWSARFRILAQAAIGARLFITRLPVCFKSPPWVFVQRPYAWGFDTEYASWCLNRRDFLDTARHMGLQCVWEFVTGERPDILGAPDPSEYRGFLFDVPLQLTIMTSGSRPQ
jgi:putative methyltransferase (TIGR04325 family)